MDIFIADLDEERHEEKMAFCDESVRETSLMNNKRRSGMEYVDFKERQKFIEFVRATDNLNPQTGVFYSVGCSLSLLFTALNILYILDEDEIEAREEAAVGNFDGVKTRETEEPTSEDISLGFWGKAESKEEEVKEARSFTTDGISQKRKEVEASIEVLEKKLKPAYFRGTYKMLLEEWKSVEKIFIEKGVSSAKLKKDFEEGPSGGGLEIDLGFLGDWAKTPDAPPDQLVFDFGFNVQLHCEAGTTGDYDNTAQPLINRLDEIFSNIADTESNAMWYDTFRRALTMMGKSFDMKETAEQFKIALMFQRNCDERLLTYVQEKHDSNVLASVYQPRKIVQRQRAEINLNIKMAWEARKAVILEGLERYLKGWGGDRGSGSGEGGGEAREEAGYCGEEDANSKKDERVADMILIKFKYSEYEEKLPIAQYAGEMKYIISKYLGVAIKHQKLYHPKTGHLMRDSDLLENLKSVVLERPVMRAVWCQYFVDTLVEDVDEDEVLQMWGRLCKCTRDPKIRESVDTKGGPEYSEYDEEGNKIDDGDQFLYAEDLRKVIQGFGKEKMSDEEAVIFINECRPMTAKEMWVSKTEVAGFIMTDEEYAKPKNCDDLRPRIYHPWYYSALTDDTL